MELLLDTTIQIDRITGSGERKKAVQKVTENNRLFCSTYVLGEYYSNVVLDLITLYGIFLIHKDIGETGKRINEIVFGRSQARVSKLYANILSLCNFNIEQIDDTFQLYIDLIQDEFYMDLEEVLDKTKCAKANRKVVYEDGVPALTQIRCTKRENICEICQFWRESEAEIGQIMKKHHINPQIVDILNAAENEKKEYLGRNCMTLGDTIIALEALKNKEKLCVCSSNKKDFQPICDALGLDLVAPDYTWK